MAEIKIDKALFQERLSSFISAWKADKRGGDAVFGGVSSILVLLGKSEETAQFQKNNAVHFWLLGYEFPATLFLFTIDGMTIVTTAKKAAHLEPLKGGKIPLEVLVRGKNGEENEKLFTKITKQIKSAGKKLGVITKDISRGPFIEEWKKSYGSISKDVEEVEIGPALSQAALAVKEESELRAMRSASKACVALMNPYFVEEMSNVLDEEKKVKHSTLANKIDSKLDDTKWWKSVELPGKGKMPSDLDPTQLDWTHGPIVQSGGKFDLKMTARVDDEILHAGVILASLGMRYKQYCSLIARTYLVDPNKSQESAYKLLLQIHNLVMKEVRDGANVKDIYAKAIGLVKSKKPELEKNFLKNVGAGIGIEMRDSTLILNAKSSRILKDGMTLCITTGFNDIENPNPQDKKSKTYSLVLSDTIRVSSSDPVIFTGDAPSDLDATSFFFKDDEEAQPTPKKSKKDSTIGAVATKNITKSKLRAERTTQADEGAEHRRREHQKELALKKQEEGLKRFAEVTGNQNGSAVKKFKRFESYKRDNQFPPRVRDLAIVMDKHNQTIVLPIMGRPVPFHIQTIKNASKSDEGDFSYLRINFLSPGQGVGRKDDQPFEDATAHFVRSLTFRSHEGDRFQNIANEISNMKKEAVKKEQEKKELEDVVEQDKLVEIRNRRPAFMDNVFIRPAMDGKRIAGKVEIHQNGLRYQSVVQQQQRVDILFSNVKHLFFQPCQHELIVIIHVHLKDPILIGKKKTKDVQFYREATDIQFDETGNRKRKYRYGDEEEFEAEQEERRRRADLDRQFKAFAEKVAEGGRSENVDVDVPFRELGFNGVPNRSNVFCQPSTDCLVQLTEPPFMVITLEDIEVAHLERVQFGLKNFDMVFIFKDFTRTPAHINTIPVESLENVKEWLDSVNIPFTDGPLNLNWPTIMKTVVADPHAFFEDGGWGFLSNETDAEDDDPESEESAFEISSSEANASDESSNEDSEFDSNASDDEGSAGSDDGESEGEDWDELEKKAKRKDRDGGLDDEEEAPKKKRKH
ncbi:FACT complex subunit-domain-containing protein [Amylocarpus encephaloides]|uniref:FACT complex subunit n=1 Tax=Amylocarpus encephaloides TaxID=45428 RepID=A0A9P8C3Y2_9HELO|nr:FACT complex subunit-domain-containing protein [Amylocarpus encephaloides]